MYAVAIKRDFVAPTRREAERLLKVTHAQKQKAFITYPGSDRLNPQISDEELKNRTPDGLLRLLFLGNVTPRKGLHIAVEAL